MSIRPSPLPSDLPEAFALDEAVEAYEIVLGLEDELMKEKRGGRIRNRELVQCRILGYLFHYAPGTRGKAVVTADVLNCQRDRQTLLDLGQWYRNYFIRPFKASKGPTPKNSCHPTCMFFKELVGEMKKKRLNKCRGGSKAKDDALRRDGYRCVVSGFDDRNTVEKNARIRHQAQTAAAKNNRPFRTMNTEGAHIFDQSTNDVEGRQDKVTYAATMWAIHFEFGFEDLVDDLNGGRIHRLENVITLTGDLHKEFDSLHMWFVPEHLPHTFRVKSSRIFAVRDIPEEIITFRTPNATTYPLPSPDYLAIHAACCEIANRSGALA